MDVNQAIPLSTNPIDLGVETKSQAR